MKNFKAESKKVMDLMINSIYTNKEIFIRELISNASDALDKLYYQSLSNGVTGISRDELCIKIKIDKENKTLIISDNGIGMDKDSLEQNLGTIAKSGSQDFKQNMNNKETDISIIGQFGVGFYSSFMVADKVEVVSKSVNSEESYKWTSCGADGYEIEPAEKNTRGTDIILHIKSDTEDECFDRYLDEFEIRSLIKKYSDFVRYPIKLETKKTEKDNDGKEISTTEWETVNEMLPLWRKDKKEIKEEEYDNFYSSMFYDYEKPLKVLHLNMEGRVEFKALLFIPQKAPYDYYTKEFEKGLKLYTNGVLITDKCANLLPDYLSFVKGVVDAELPLNVSRETLQDSKEVKLIAKSIETKVLEALKEMQKENRENYEKFFTSFGLQFKYCIYKSYGYEKDKLEDLLLYHSLKQNKLITLEEYVTSKNEGQKKIFYACGKNIDAIKVLPQVDMSLANGNDVLCFTDDFDEFAIKFLGDYKEMEFVNVTSEKFAEESETSEEDKDLLEFIKKTLDGKIKDVKLTTNLNRYPIALSTEGDLSLEMEKVLAAQSSPEKPKAERILKIKKDSVVFDKLQSLYQTDKEKLTKLITLLYAEAELVSGVEIDDIQNFVNIINELI